MELIDKVSVNPIICGIELDFSGQLDPQNATGFQQFYDSKGNLLTWEEIYFGKKTVTFRETSKESKEGTSYTQKLTIKFPSNDKNRSKRIELIKKVKFIKLILDTGEKMVIGRNDFFQNKRPQVIISSNVAQTTVSFTAQSIFPIGFVTEISADLLSTLLPADIPITFINI